MQLTMHRSARADRPLARRLPARHLPAVVCAVVALAAPALASAASAPCLFEASPPELLPEAETAGLLTCDALRRRGVDVGAPAPGAGVAGPAVRVSLHRLGDQYLLRVDRQGIAGAPDATESVRIARLADAERAAPRIAEALTAGRSLAESAEVGTLTAAEGERAPRKGGQFLWGFGLFGTGILGSESFGGAGFQAVFLYETAHFAAVGALRAGGDRHGGLGEIGIGGRTFFSAGDTAAFVGGGLSALTLSANLESARTGYEDSHQAEGLAAYVEAGVEFLRLYDSRLIAELRVGLPFFRVHTHPQWAYETDGDVSIDRQSLHYVVPATLGVSYVW